MDRAPAVNPAGALACQEPVCDPPGPRGPLALATERDMAVRAPRRPPRDFAVRCRQGRWSGDCSRWSDMMNIAVPLVAGLVLGLSTSPAGASPGTITPAAGLQSGAPGTVAVDAAAATPPSSGAPDQGTHRNFAIAAIGGLASPVGFAGVEVAYRPHEMIELAAGLGAGGSGPQRAAMVRWRLGNRRNAFVMGVGASYGHYEEHEVFCLDGSCAAIAGDFTWLNSELGVEGTRPSGLFGRLSLGLGVVLDRANVVQANDGIERTTLPYAALTVGQAF